MDNEKILTNKEENIEINAPLNENAPIKKKQLALKIIASILFAVVSAVSLLFEIGFFVEALLLVTKPELGLEGLALVLLLPALIIVPIASLVLYIVPFVLSLVGLIKSLKKDKSGRIFTGKVYFGVLFGLIVAVECIIILMSAIIFIIATR